MVGDRQHMEQGLIARSISTRCQCQGEECRLMHSSREFFFVLEERGRMQDGVVESLEVSELDALE